MKSPIVARRLGNSAILIGMALLIWLPFEDRSDTWVLVFAVAIAGLGGLVWRYRIRRNDWWVDPLIGFGSGLAVMPLAITLFAIKSGVHGHGFPDFTPEQVITVIRSTPIWVLAGLMIGGGAALLEKVKA